MPEQIDNALPAPAEKEAHSQASAFLAALFEHMPPGFIEVRVIEDRKGGKVLVRRWYPSAAALLEALPKMAEYAAAKDAGVFFGVLPRKENGLGTAADVLAGYAAWADLDFRDYPGGEPECLAKLDGFPFSPTGVVRTGHGLHSYWLMREPEAPGSLVGLSKRLAKALGGDHVADAARILRMPGTENRKDPAEPRLVAFHDLSLERRYNPADLEESLPDPDPDTPAAEDDTEIAIGPEISQRVISLLGDQPRLRSLFEGRGKPLKDEQGRQLDTTSSGYDYSFVLALAKKGIDDPAELATALWHRPDDAARSKGRRYVIRTVLNALERARASERKSHEGTAGKPDKNKCELDFEVEKIRIHTCDPRIYEFTISGVTFRTTSYQIMAPSRFRLRFVDAIGRIPYIRASKEGWCLKVNEWLAQAEKVDQPPDAFDTEEQCEEIQLAIASLAVGEKVSDLDQGKVLQIEGQTFFKTRTLQKVLKETWADIKRQVLCSHLRNLGYVSKTVRIDEAVVRLWTKDAEHTREGAEGEVHTPPTSSTGRGGVAETSI